MHPRFLKRMVDVHDLTLISETNVPSLESPFAICASTKDQFQLFVSDLRLNKIFSISNVLQDEETGFFGSLREVLTFERSSVLTALALTRDELYMLVGDCDVNGSNIHLCQVDEGVKIRVISNLPGPMGIAVTEEGTVFVSCSKEHALYSVREEEMLQDTNTLSRSCGDASAGHRDGVESKWNMPSALCAYRNTVFVCDTDNKAVRMLTSAKGLIPLQTVMAGYAKIFRLDREAKEDNRPVTFDENMKHVEDVNAFFSAHEQEALERTRKRSTNGPDMTVPRTTRQSFRIALDSLTSLVNIMTEIGQDHLLNDICFESMTTLGVECFFKGMRADHDMPTVTGYAYRRARSVEDDMLRIYQKPFSYFTGPNSYYPEKSLKGTPRTSRLEGTSKRVHPKEQATRKKIRGEKI